MKNQSFAIRKVSEQVAQKRRKKTAGKKADSTVAGKTGLSSADIEHFKEILLEKRRDIVGDVNEMRDEALKQSRLDAAGDLSSMPIHMADIGTDNYQQELALGLMDSERKMLRKIDEALERIEQKTYGTCQATGEPIVRDRLEAKPWARYCVEYARKLEQGSTTEQEQ